MKRSLAAALLSFSVAACGGSVPPPRPAPSELPSDDGCTRDTLEPDFQSSPLQGPAVDAQGKLVPGTYIMSSTYLRMRNTQEAQEEFQQLMGPINQTLEEQPGLVAIQFGSSTRCNTKRTFTIWKDEESMYQFVGSPAHTQAIARVSLVSRGGTSVTSWQDDERGATWEKALQQLASETRPTY
ncbi:antibiotic biosynthesis monooxygenase [Archangium lipolyticum]|uniref:antibiotic biosynthesis monooxygenase n=1 Tax=Archangium lipolyticum TaxID=2970465 RepID=UPI00214A68FE|nr:antibiotic biosynthesis monooxygenase [Archangium lipolyticum]